jgi:hypothetical protein
LGVQRNTEGSLFHTNETLGKCWRFWAEGAKGMKKTGVLTTIVAQQEFVLHVNCNNLKKQFAKQLGLSIIQKMRWN